MTDTRLIFARNFRAARAAMGLDQPAFGELLNVSVQMVSAYENAKSLPSPQTLSLLVEATGRPLASFFLGEGETVEAAVETPLPPSPEEALAVIVDTMRRAEMAESNLVEIKSAVRKVISRNPDAWPADVKAMVDANPGDPDLDRLGTWLESDDDEPLQAGKVRGAPLAARNDLNEKKRGRGK